MGYIPPPVPSPAAVAMGTAQVDPTGDPNLEAKAKDPPESQTWFIGLSAREAQSMGLTIDKGLYGLDLFSWITKTAARKLDNDDGARKEARSKAKSQRALLFEVKSGDFSSAQHVALAGFRESLGLSQEVSRTHT